MPITSIFNSTAPDRVSGDEQGNSLQGSVVWVQVFSDTGLESFFDARLVPPGTTSFTDSLGHTWALTGTAAIVNDVSITELYNRPAARRSNILDYDNDGVEKPITGIIVIGQGEGNDQFTQYVQNTDGVVPLWEATLPVKDQDNSAHLLDLAAYHLALNSPTKSGYTLTLDPNITPTADAVVPGRIFDLRIDHQHTQEEGKFWIGRRRVTLSHEQQENVTLEVLPFDLTVSTPVDPPPVIPDAAVHTVTPTTNNVLQTTHLFDLPATVDVGDQLLASVTFGDDSITPENALSSWTLVHSGNLNTDHGWRVYWKRAVGNEDGGTLSFDTVASCKSSGEVHRIQAGFETGGVGVAYDRSPNPTTASSNSPDPQPITPSWGLAKNLFVAIGTAGPDGATVSTVPAGYGNGTQTAIAANYITYSADLTAELDFSNPSSFMLDQVENHQSMGFVFRPAAGTTPTGPTAPTDSETIGSTEPGFPTTHTITLPVSVAGDQLVVQFGMDGSGGDISGPVAAGWLEVVTHDLNANQKHRIWWKRATGTEGTTLIVNTTLGNHSASTATRVSNGFSTGGLATAFDIGSFQISTNSANSNPPPVTASWGTEVGADNLFMAFSWGGSDGRNITTYSTNYINGIEAISVVGAGGVTATRATRLLEAATDDPDSFVYNGAQNNTAVTMVFRPNTDEVVVPPTEGTPAPTIPLFLFATATQIAAGSNVAAVVAAGIVGEHFSMLAGSHDVGNGVLIKTDQHIRLEPGAVIDGSIGNKGYCFRPQNATTTGVVIGGIGTPRPNIKNFGQGTDRQEYGAIMGDTTDILGGEFIYTDVDDWFIYGLKFEENSSNGIHMGSNWTIFDCELSGHTVTGIGVDRIVGGLIHSCDLYWNGLDPATGSGANGADIKLTWVNGFLGRTEITPVDRTAAPLIISNTTFNSLDQKATPGPGDADIGCWLDLDCNQVFVEYCNFNDYPVIGLFIEGCNFCEEHHNTFNDCPGFGPIYGFNFVPASAVLYSESTNIHGHHDTFNNCSYARVIRLVNREDDWLSPTDFNNYAYSAGTKYWMFDTTTQPASPGQSNIWTSDILCEFDTYNNCDFVAITEGEDNVQIVQTAIPLASIQFRDNNYGTGMQFVNGSPGTLISEAAWRALVGLDRY